MGRVRDGHQFAPNDAQSLVGNAADNITSRTAQPRRGIEMIDHIELRLSYHRNVYMARIAGRSRRYGLERDFHCLRRTREIADYNSGWVKWRVVYHLPLIAAVYEVRDDQNVRSYIATRPATMPSTSSIGNGLKPAWTRTLTSTRSSGEQRAHRGVRRSPAS